MQPKCKWLSAVGLFLLSSASVLAQDAPPLKPEELEQIVAPIALYPDSVISQVLMASTYPVEVVEADRWTKQNASLKGDPLTDALEKQSWDPSVKSLVNFPDVLSMMSEKLDWTTKLGDAFIAQQKGVMDAIQSLRGRAKMQGNLETNEQQKVTVTQEAATQVIVVESADPQVVYVPTYNPTVVYGSWPYPAYPPYYYYPPGYVAGAAAVSFGVGLACGAAWGYAWGGCNWGHGDVDIDVRRNSFNNTRIDRNRYSNNIGNNNRNFNNGRGTFQHDPSHRKGAGYRDGATAQKYGGKSASDAARARDDFRGRAEAGRQDIARGGADQFKRDGAGANRTSTNDRPGGGQNRGNMADRGGAGDRGGANRPTTNDRPSAGQNRGGAADKSRPTQSNRGGAFDGVNDGQRARSDSNRGQASRSSSSRPSSSSASRPSSSGSSRSSGASRGSGGGSRGGGGGARGGGGGGRGGGGRGGRR